MDRERHALSAPEESPGRAAVSRPDKRGIRRGFFAALLAVSLGAWFGLRARLAEEVAHPGREALAGRPSAQTPLAPVHTLDAARRDDGAFAGARPEAAREPSDDGTTLIQPHPADPARAALIPPWAAFEEVESALAERDFERARKQLALRQEQDPDPADFRDFYVGLDIMLQCLEAPGTASRARAESFIDEYRASPLRRHVRRSCTKVERAAALE